MSCNQLGGDRAVILLVDDDPGDQELTRRAIQEDVLRADLRIVSDGEEALDYLFQRGAYEAVESAPRPNLILLDLNMPKVGGQEVLTEIKQHPELNRIPVVILTTSEQEADILRSYNLGCNSYIQKPVDIDRFIECIRQLRTYWFELVVLPAKCAAT